VLLSDLPPADGFSVELLLREALTNAVFHRSPAVCGAGIWYEVAFRQGEIVIRVDDGGEGFEWRNWQAPELPPVQEHGMGLHILHRYASRVRFSGNGSAVELVRTLQGGTQ
jgi:serine/threonine-protein kinase RsbW